MSTSAPRMRLLQLTPAVLAALVDADLDGASSAAGVKMTPFMLSYRWLWEVRSEQLASTPSDIDWIARAVVDEESSVLGLAGFHEGPGDRGWVEVSYAIDPAFRRQGYGHAALGAAIRWARGARGVRTVKASVSPDNRASLIILNKAGFLPVGEQIDPQDGLELVFELSLNEGA